MRMTGTTTIPRGYSKFGIAWLLLLVIASYDGGSNMMIRPVSGYPMIMEIGESDERVSLALMMGETVSHELRIKSQ
jgi:hypothetical protein